MDLFGSATLRHPTWYSDSTFEELPLPLTPGHYEVTPGEGRDGRWAVTTSKGETVYQGIGPVTVVPA